MCPVRQATCFNCRQVGHFEVACRSTKSVDAISKHTDPEVAFLGEVTKNGDPWTSTVAMEAMGTQCRAEVCLRLDTVADVTVISQSDYMRAGSPCLDASTKKLVGVNDNVLQGLVTVNGRLSQDGAVIDEDIYVISGQRRSLLRRSACETLNLVKLVALDSVETADYYKDKNPELFGGLGGMSGGDYRIQLREDAVPFALSTPRRVSIPLMDVVKRELQKMEDLQVIRRVDTPTDWCAGMVVVAKSRVVSSTVEGEEKETHKVRIRVDLTKLNESVMREKHYLPSVDQTLGRLAGAKVFTKLDANSGFWQIPLAPSSQELTTFITPFGRYCFRRLPFWITLAPEHFQKRMHNILEDLPGVLCMMDDLIIFGESSEEHDVRVRAVSRRLEDSGVTLNFEKCEFAKSNITYLIHVVSADEIRTDPSKMRAIKQMQQPKYVGDIRRFLGMANQLGKFIPNLSTVTQPLRDLLQKKNQWTWGPSQQRTFDLVKDELSKTPVLALYDPNRETTVSADASSYGLGAVLRQRTDGTLRPVTYASRAMTPTKQRYSLIEKEAIATT